MRRRNQARPRREATQAREHAERQLEVVKAETQKYRALAEVLRRIREVNHIAEGLEETLRLRRGGAR